MTRNGEARQNRHIQRGGAVRHRDMAGRILAGVEKSRSAKGEAMASVTDCHYPPLAESGKPVGIRGAQSMSVQPSPRGGFSRPPVGTSESSRHKEKRTLVVGQQRPQIRKRHFGLTGTEQNAEHSGDLREVCSRQLRGSFSQETGRNSPKRCVMPICLSDHQIKSRLRSHFRKALRAAKFSTCQIFLELYAGSAPVSSHIKKAGYAVLAFEITQGAEFDLTDKRVHAVLLGWLRSKCIAGVFISVQCSSWSRALRGPPGSNWAAIRSGSNIKGLPNLSDSQKKRVDLGNLQLSLVYEIISICNLLNIPSMLENPACSYIFDTTEISRLTNLPSCQLFVRDQCQYGTPWRKATKFLLWNCNYVRSLDSRCAGRHGFCSRTGKHHIVLSGASKKHGVLWTSIAQQYPPALAAHIGSSLIDSAVSRRLGV